MTIETAHQVAEPAVGRNPALEGPEIPGSPRPLSATSKTGRGDRPDGITIIERLGPRVAIGADDYQWVVLRDVGQGERGREGGSHNWQGRQWRAVGFVHSSKRALLDCIAAKGLDLSPEGRAAIARQDARIYRWRRAVPMEAAA